MNNRRKNIRIFILISIVIMLILGGCRKKPKKMAESVKKNKISKELQQIYLDTNGLEKKIDEIEKEKGKNEEIEIQKQKDKIIKKIEEEASGKKNGEEESKKSEEDGASKVLETQQQTIYELWNTINSRVENIHKLWDSYKVEAIKDKADTEQIKDFEEKLNNLTISVQNQKYEKTLFDLNSLYSSIAYFTSIYESYDAEIIQLKHDTNQVYIDGVANKWKSAEESMKQATEQYKKVFKECNRKLKDNSNKKEGEKKKEQLDKLELSIESLKLAIEKKDAKLLNIKRRIINDNIEKAQKQ